MAFPIMYIGIIMPYNLCFLEVFELWELRTGFTSLGDVESTQTGNATGGLSNDQAPFDLRSNAINYCN